MIKNIKKVTVKYNGNTVGYLAEIDYKVIGFQYDEKWIKNGFPISPFSLPLDREVFISNKPYFQGLYGVFWDSLPDGWGELLLNRYLTKKGINPNKLNVLTKLTLISNNGLGGLTYEPSQPVEEHPLTQSFDSLCSEINNLLNDGESAAELDVIYSLGGSSGGARPKAHISIDGEEWIIKFPCKIDPQNIGEKEYLANLTAQKCGINVNEFRLFPSEKCSGYFGAKRFDRNKNKRVHMISLSGLLETTHRLPNLDYTHLFQVSQNISVNPNEEFYEIFRRMCFNVLYKNKDDHGKNFAFIYDENIGGYKLSPAYDITSVPDKFEHEMTVNGQGNPKCSDLLKVAAAFNANSIKCKKILNLIQSYCLT